VGEGLKLEIITAGDKYSYLNRPKARFPPPELTARVRPELTGDRFPLPVNTGRVDGRAFPLAELRGRQLGYSGNRA